MKNIALIAVAVAMSFVGSAAIAGEVPTDANVPTGYKVKNADKPIVIPNGVAIPGCTYRRPSTGEQVCNPNSIRDLSIDGTNRALPYSNAFNSHSG